MPVMTRERPPKRTVTTSPSEQRRRAARFLRFVRKQRDECRRRGDDLNATRFKWQSWAVQECLHVLGAGSLAVLRERVRWFECPSETALFRLPEET